jgi:DNA-binding IclR family transcriptional regulator
MPATNLEGVDRALRILETFPRDRQDVSLTELSERVGIHPSIVFRILRTCVARGFISKDPTTRRYSLGPRLLELGLSAVGHLDLRQQALPVMQRLSAAVGETVLLLVHRDGRALCIERVEAQGPRLRATAEVGLRLALHAGAGTKLLLAFRPEEEIEKHLRGPLPRLTPNTITDPDRLRDTLAELRAQGYAISYAEAELGLAAVAAPIRDHSGSVVAALSVMGPEVRFGADRVRLLVRHALRAAREISSHLGHRQSRTHQTVKIRHARRRGKARTS